uniref:Uncharacterized protein n=1 Tax=Arsenophonus endosymbiont of Trialeurodes vaporariorum TaxID=235567 RepID=A0A3B0MHI3_9GAMM
MVTLTIAVFIVSYLMFELSIFISLTRWNSWLLIRI